MEWTGEALHQLASRLEERTKKDMPRDFLEDITAISQTAAFHTEYTDNRDTFEDAEALGTVEETTAML
jgi:hypothetical protein